MIGVLWSYAYFQIENNSRNEELTIHTGNIAITFNDGNDSFKGNLDFGSSAEKTFTLENNGTIDAIVSMNFKDLVNTYILGSLTYTLEESETEDGPYSPLVENKNVPLSTVKSEHTLIGAISIKANTIKYYKLIITLNNLNIDQTADLDALFFSQFVIGDKKEISKEPFEMKSAISAIKAGQTPNGVKDGKPIFGLSPIFDHNEKLIELKNIDISEIANGDNIKYIDDKKQLTMEIGSRYWEYSTIFSPNKSGNMSLCYSNYLYESVPFELYLDDVFIKKLGNTSECISLGNVDESSRIKIYLNEGETAYIWAGIFALMENFESEDKSSVYSMQDDFGTSYYYRGETQNNYVKFADKFWRIVRINGDGSIRIAYDGTSAHENNDKSEDRVALLNKQYNTNRNDRKYVGYMYGPAGETASTSIEEAHSNIEDSAVKKELDNWYETNIPINLREYLADSGFCNDRSLNENQEYNTKQRLEPKINTIRTLINNEELTPILTCNRKQDLFTVDSEVGNRKLQYPIATLSADEVLIAGGSGLTSNFYLNKGKEFWTMTPKEKFASSSMVFAYDYTISTLYSDETGGIVPVINLTSDTALSMIGTGTATDPYRLAD